jgi:chromosome segregation ATPase
LQLSSDFQCEGSRGVNPRIECRSCWQTFPVPEGLLWMVAAEQAAGTSIEAKFSGDVAGLREQTASLTAIEQLLAPKVTATEAAQRALEAQQNSLNDRVGSLDGLVQALQGRLVTQADAIRDLHATVEDQAKHRADLLSAARKLQEIAGVIEPSKPLPEGL